LYFHITINTFDKKAGMTEKKVKNPRFLGISLDRLKNKYILASVFFIVWVGFFDQNNLFERFQNMRELKKLSEDKEYYQSKISEESERLKELKTNKENLEKFAREQYLMKRDNEDVFIIVDE
jgi:cell division protein DivIC